MSSPVTGRSAWIAAFVLLMTFGSGALAGIALDRLLLSPSGPPFGGPPGFSRLRMAPPAFPPDVLQREDLLWMELDLTDDQRARIDSILASDREKAAVLLDQVRPRLQTRYDSTTAAIVDVLDAEQRARFDSLMEQRRWRLQERFERGFSPNRPGTPFPGTRP